MKLFPILTSLLSLMIVASCTKDVGPNPDLLPKPLGGCDTVKYSTHIAPLFTNYCAPCHSPSGGQSPDLTDYATLKSQVDGGRIKARLIDQLPSPMPPPGSISPTDSEVDLIRCWMENGAPNN
ncbi:MAG: cytochrome c [Bacteroidetes bacterium]|jgi:hypothetical protein|nr:cytochrome c [Bacteroidota bacterium]MDF2452324.1 cytochrome c [Bacteroidota bacterium]